MGSVTVLNSSPRTEIGGGNETGEGGVAQLKKKLQVVKMIKLADDSHQRSKKTSGNMTLPTMDRSDANMSDDL